MGVATWGQKGNFRVSSARLKHEKLEAHYETGANSDPALNYLKIIKGQVSSLLGLDLEVHRGG